uniref:Putative lipase YOR059C n=1 Tax=Anthurium amnicola TaxID=1678845 RepID=A0A1D1YD54_9ARAE
MGSSPNASGSSRRRAVTAAGEDPAPAGGGKEEELGREKKSRKKGSPSYYIRRRLGCVGDGAAGDERGTAGRGGAHLYQAAQEGGRIPTHLVIMVNGIIGSAGDWRFAAKHFVKKLPEDVIVHRSECNSNLLTLHGVDIMGERLAKEVLSFVKRRPELRKISFVGHSLGGLIARYAIARLYEPGLPQEAFEANGNRKDHDAGVKHLEERSMGKIAGLEPMNFITFATPHLGARWHRQMPFLCGFQLLERMASRGSWILRRTGKHLFLNDKDEDKPPLLLRMIKDSEDLLFISALRSFRRRVAYSNACSDHVVGWATSSIRRQHELPKREVFTRNKKYPHIVHVESPKAVTVEQDLPLDINTKTLDMQEAMINGLNKVTWERVDVSFRKSKQRLFAHTTIQVKTYWMNSDGADVIFHMIDNFLLL